MIYYFSGTGNSRHVAEAVASAQKQGLASIPEAYGKSGKEVVCTLAEGEMLGFVFPVYAWAPPRMVVDFILRMRIEGGIPYTFSISTCGGTEGNATGVIRKALARKGLELDGAFTIVMPGNYIIGMDVKPLEQERDILSAAEGRIAEINVKLGNRDSPTYDLIPGRSPAMKTALVGAMFNSFARSTKPFYATDACTRCKLCEKVCPVHTIVVREKPIWGKSCTQCLACINRCPARAIQYGAKTLNRGRYVHPDLRRGPA